MNLKINIKRPQITKEEIAANKNFGEVLQMYKSASGGKATPPFYKTTWFYAGFSAAAAVVIAIIIYFQPTGNKHHELAGAFIAPPLEKVRIIPSQYAVNADKGTTITYKTGSVIKIPAKAFVDKSGKPVYGKVDVTYRELSEPVDFFISGIPMNYDSAGTHYTFESAGMIEIHASQNGKELDLDPTKEFAVALASHQTGNQYNLYKLDTEKKQWIYKGQEETSGLADQAKEKGAESAADNSPAAVNADNSAATSPQIAALTSKLEDAEYEIKKSEIAIRRMEASKPFEPKEETKGHHRFSVEVTNLNEFPELAIYKDVMFQAGDENKDFDKKAYNIDWDDARLSKKGENYVLTLRNADQTSGYIVHPVFEGEGYNTAQQIYKTRLEQYEETLVERKATEGEKQQELSAFAEVVKDSRDSEVARVRQKEDLKEFAANATPSNPGNLTFHNFRIHSCGIWNLDNPNTLPQGAMVTPHFTDEQGKEIKFAEGKVYLVEKGRNILFTFDGNSSIAYNPEKENMIWGVTADNKIAVFNYDSFKTAGKQSGNYTFKMKVSDLDLADESQVEYYLNI